MLGHRVNRDVSATNTSKRMSSWLVLFCFLYLVFWWRNKSRATLETVHRGHSSAQSLEPIPRHTATGTPRNATLRPGRQQSRQMLGCFFPIMSVRSVHGTHRQQTAAWARTNGPDGSTRQSTPFPGQLIRPLAFGGPSDGRGQQGTGKEQRRKSGNWPDDKPARRTPPT